jgi:MoaA/NifB/PqqE/SkfB family radical SAM enzyme
MRLLTILIIASPITLLAQSRVDRAKLSFDRTSDILENATGWAYNSTLGEWINYENFIRPLKDYKDKKFKASYNGLVQSTQSQNFIKMQSKIIEYSNRKYYVLIIQKWRGQYKYESIKEDWYIWKETLGYIFTESEYSKLKDMTGLVELKTQFLASIGSVKEKYDEVKFLDLLQSELEQTQVWDYIFPILNVESDGKKVTRFYLPHDSQEYPKYDFKLRYFETSPTEFEKIVIKD